MFAKYYSVASISVLFVFNSRDVVMVRIYCTAVDVADLILNLSAPLV